ncbi:hypothetical protein DHC50_01790 [Arenibacter sp. A80]|nr:hypothetical protein [Arenibacter sp. A80]RFT57919.1 DUF4974 domain-containing protein [Arenibacter sp. P308M17]
MEIALKPIQVRKENSIPNGSDQLTDSERVELRARIFKSVHSFKRRRRGVRYATGMAMAASLAIIVGLVYLREDPAVSISDFARSSAAKDGKGPDKVVLVLDSGENVTLDEETARINYSTTGERVDIGNNQAIAQQVSKEKEMVYNTLIVPYGKRSEVQLSDGTRVWLNSGSRLVYPAVFAPDKREVYLDGEAIFEVAHNSERPFMVLSEGQEIEVLGTVFNVSNYLDEGSINTVLKSGSIRISYGEGSILSGRDQLQILPGTMASYDRDIKNMSSKAVDVEQYFSWRDGVLIFKNDDLRYIIKRLSRYYNVEINIAEGASGEGTFSGYLDLKEDIEKVIETIREATDLEYERVDENKITITI